MLQRRSKQLWTHLARWNVIADCLKVNKVNLTATAGPTNIKRAPESQPYQGATLVNNCKTIQRINRAPNPTQPYQGATMANNCETIQRIKTRGLPTQPYQEHQQLSDGMDLPPA